jgi:hypothetical protein
MSDLSRSALLAFVDYLSAKGLMNKTTASARKAAANRVLGVLDEVEASDVSQLDLDDVMTRFHHLEGSKFKPQSLNTYKSRLKSVIEDFLRYQRDPMNFKPNGQSSGRRTPDRARASDSPAPLRHESVRRSSEQTVEAPPASVSILPIPIRADLTIKVQGLPFDLTVGEANKIANVIKAMAQQD